MSVIIIDPKFKQHINALKAVVDTAEILVITVTNDYSFNEIIDITTGNGNLGGSGIIGGPIFELPRFIDEFNTSYDIDFFINEELQLRGTDVICVNELSFKAAKTIPTGSVIAVIKRNLSIHGNHIMPGTVYERHLTPELRDKINRQGTSHTHPINQVEGLETRLNSIEEDVSYKASITHNHTLLGLQEKNYTSLDNRPSHLKINSFLGGGIYEKGQLIQNVNLSWDLDGEIYEQIINQSIGTLQANVRNYTHVNANLTSDITYILSVSDHLKTLTAETSVLFRNSFYFGTSDLQNIDNALILNNFQSILLNETKLQFDDMFGNGEYLYFCFPATNNYEIKINGMVTTAWEESIIPGFMNFSNHMEDYMVVRSTNILYNDVDITIELD